MRQCFIFLSIAAVVVLGGCRSSSSIESGGDLVRDDRQRVRELETLLEGHFVANTSPQSSSETCSGQRVEFVGALIRVTEVQYSKPHCAGEPRGEVSYLGRVKIGGLSLEDSGSRPMEIDIQEVRVKALRAGWGLPQPDNCGLFLLAAGESKIVTGQSCSVFGEGRFPAVGEKYHTVIAINSGQRISIDYLPRVLPRSSPERGPASARSRGPVEFERTQRDL